MISIKPNEWQFSEKEIKEIKLYAKSNNLKYSKARLYTDYHHCTDTHKHIIYKLLKNPKDLFLGNDQTQSRNTPNDYKKAGESTTDGIRNTIISKTYAEPSKIFTVVDTNNEEVLGRNGKAGNTDNELKGFKESPIEYMKKKCPDNGFYVFIGAYNADYHSFTIIVDKKQDKFSFEFLDQLEGILNLNGKEIEDRFLYYIDGWKSNYPMKLELYQLRNKKK